MSFALTLFTPVVCSAGQSVSPAGFMLDYVEESPPSEPPARGGEASVVEGFLQNQIPKGFEAFSWRKWNALKDETHDHRLYALTYRGRRVVGQYLRLHYNLKGWVQYASSTWDRGFIPTRIPSLSETESLKLARERALKKQYARVDGKFDGVIRIEPVFFAVPGSSQMLPAYSIKLSTFHPLGVRDWIEEEKSGKILQENTAIRFLTAPGKGYLSSPYNGGTNNATPDSVTLPGLNDATKLVSDYVHVRREEEASLGAATASLVEVDPSFNSGDYTGAGFSTDPASDGGLTCHGNSQSCPNQAFDAINVYYHLTNYRTTLDTYFKTLGVTSPAKLDVIVNALDVRVYGTDFSKEVNNAAFIPRPCTTDTDGSTIEQCLVFLRPDTSTSSVCGSGPKQFYSLAREALVAVHEFEHYITDYLGHFQSDADNTNVGDAIHEGYSDYMAASQVSGLNSSDVTKVGEYGFQKCPYFIRDVGVLRPFVESSQQGDPHFAGLTWASGLWKLRTELGRAVVDQLALKSMTLLPVKPGFIQTVESLVRADVALNQGAHTSRIRQLFFDDLKFTGAQSVQFRDSAKKVVEVGFRSCASVPMAGESGAGAFGGLLVWWQLSWVMGRLWQRRLNKPRREIP